MAFGSPGHSPTDVIFARKGRLGLARRPPRAKRYAFSHTVFIFKAAPAISSDYLLWLLRTDFGLAWLTLNMNSNSGVPTLGKAVTEQLPVPIAPREEQDVIVARVQAMFGNRLRLEQMLSEVDLQMAQLDTAILSKAFRGELVPQEAGDAVDLTGAHRPSAAKGR
jgi:type I restriction enzyme, S subunit